MDGYHLERSSAATNSKSDKLDDDEDNDLESQSIQSVAESPALASRKFPKLENFKT